MRTLVATVTLLTISAAVASGAVIISAGNSPMDGNIVFNGTGTSTVDPLVGRVNGTTDLYAFTSSDVLKAHGIGNAMVTSEDGSFVDLALTSMGGYFSSAVLNLQAYDPSGPARPVDGTVRFTVNLVGKPDYVSELLFVSASGNNFFHFEADGDDRMTGIRLLSSTQLSGVRHIRVGGAENIPEPSSLFLLGCGLASLAYAGWTKRIKAAR